MTTPRNPDNDTLDDGTHGGESEQEASGRTPRTTQNDNDVPDGPQQEARRTPKGPDSASRGPSGRAEV